jgi:hypothetical protein
MVYRTADDVADMEQELHELRVRLEHTARNLEIVSAECNRLKVENALMDAKSRDYLVKATRAEQLMTGVATMIVSGIREFKEEREQARAVRRQEQTVALEADNEEDPPPGFLRRARPPEPPPQAQVPEPYGRAPIAAPAPGASLARAAEQIAPLPRAGRINLALAAADPRMPKNDFVREDQAERDSLLNLVDNMGKTR